MIDSLCPAVAHTRDHGTVFCDGIPGHDGVHHSQPFPVRMATGLKVGGVGLRSIPLPLGASETRRYLWEDAA